MSPLGALLLAPLIAGQALWTKLLTRRLDAPPGPREGSVGSGCAVSLLVLGASSAARVGAPHQQLALVHPLACELARLLGQRVDWRLVADSGLNTNELLDFWHIADRPAAELVVVVSGVNDVVDRLDTAAVAAARDRLTRELQATGRVRRIVFTPPPPMHAFTALPRPLRDYAGDRARAHGEALRSWQNSRPGTSVADFAFTPAGNQLAADGFHPGTAAYSTWTIALARHLRVHAPPPA